MPTSAPHSRIARLASRSSSRAAEPGRALGPTGRKDCRAGQPADRAQRADRPSRPRAQTQRQQLAATRDRTGAARDEITSLTERLAERERDLQIAEIRERDLRSMLTVCRQCNCIATPRSWQPSAPCSAGTTERPSIDLPSQAGWASATVRRSRMCRVRRAHAGRPRSATRRCCFSAIARPNPFRDRPLVSQPTTLTCAGTRRLSSSKHCATPEQSSCWCQAPRCRGLPPIRSSSATWKRDTPSSRASGGSVRSTPWRQAGSNSRLNHTAG